VTLGSLHGSRIDVAKHGSLPDAPGLNHSGSGSLQNFRPGLHRPGGVAGGDAGSIEEPTYHPLVDHQRDLTLPSTCELVGDSLSNGHVQNHSGTGSRREGFGQQALHLAVVSTQAPSIFGDHGV
jgi:hypothetical protein